MMRTWAPFPRTLTRRYARGQGRPRAGQGVYVRIQGLTCRSSGPRAIYRVSTRNNGFSSEQHTTTDTVVPRTQNTSDTTGRYQHFSPRWSEPRAPHPSHSVTNRGNRTIRGMTRRQHAGSQLLMLQNPTTGIEISKGSEESTSSGAHLTPTSIVAAMEAYKTPLRHPPVMASNAKQKSHATPPEQEPTRHRYPGITTMR